jgi:hypothetical protein
MMMVQLYYSTIIQIRLADAGEAGEELEAWGGTLAGRNGPNQTVTADEKIMENLGGGTTIINFTVAIAGVISLFSLFKYSYI